MICISVTPHSRQMAKVDLLNAGRQADLIELCLDPLIKEPDIFALLEGVAKPVIVSCRRVQEGGQWRGSEEERLTLLRQAVAEQPAWVELELDIAEKIPRVGRTKRLVSYTQLDRPLTNLEAIYERAVAAKANAVKFTGPTPTLDAAWPLLAAVTKKRNVPVVGMGIGRPGITFSLLGARYGSPWIYAALEQGMETHPGQATIRELEETFRYRDIGPQTRFIGVSGLGPTETATVRALNSGFIRLGLNLRCLPLQLDKLEHFEQMLDTLKISALLPDQRLGGRVLSVARFAEEPVKQSQFADLLIRRQDGWHAYNALWRGALKALEAVLGEKSPGERPLDRRHVLMIGAGAGARTIAYGVQRRKGLLSVSAADEERAQLLAQMFESPCVPLAKLSDALCDVAIITEETHDEAQRSRAIPPGFFRPHMTVMDVSLLPLETDLLREATARGATVVPPEMVYTEQLNTQFKAVTGQDLPPEALEEARSSLAAQLH